MVRKVTTGITVWSLNDVSSCDFEFILLESSEDGHIIARNM